MSEWAKSSRAKRKALKAINPVSRQCILEGIEVADTVLGRMRGLLGRDAQGNGPILWLKPCNWVHTIGMKFPIDIIYLDAENTVIKIKWSVPPGRLTAPVFMAKSVIEFPSGTINPSLISIGHRLDIS